MLGTNPAPVATDLAVGVETETDKACAVSTSSVNWSAERDNLLVTIPGSHAAKQMRTVLVIDDSATGLASNTVHSTVMEIMRIFQSTADTVSWFTKAFTMQPASATSD